MFQVLAYISYWLKAVDEHSLHSPFLFNLYLDVIKEDSDLGFHKIENLRSELLASEKSFHFEDLGAGSRVNSGEERKVSEIAKHSSTPAKFSRLLYRFIQHFGYSEVLELGTSLGLNSLYMAQASPEVQVLTFEGISEISDLARKNFQQMGASNIHMVEGNIDLTLADKIAQLKKIDLAYIDANHRYEPTLKYYELIQPKISQHGMIVIDDIHWSKEMSEAWLVLKTKAEVTLSLDLFEAGILFFNPNLKKEDYIIKF